jgi:cysteinyl-tRNA synthetase
VLQAHYRKPLDFTAAGLEAAAAGWAGLRSALAVGHHPALAWPLDPLAEPASAADGTRERFIAAMDDDLNTSAALAVLFELAKPLRALANRLERGDVAAAAEAQTPTNQQRGALLHELAGVLGLKVEADAAPAATSSGPSEAEIDALIEQRRAAKAAKDFTTADAIRAQLLEAGIELIDKPGGLTDWLRR